MGEGGQGIADDPLGIPPHLTSPPGERKRGRGVRGKVLPTPLHVKINWKICR
jgi:hypothetical protein